MIDLKKIQKEIYDNKKIKGFNIKDINFEFALAYGELAEAFDAYRKKQNNLGEELADVAIYLLGLSALLKIDLEKEIITKININQKRKYKKIKGVNIRVKD
jgi:NTP pyrophosphatase (non-canonical NTP hydrolase)